jgi:hypothetical protein
MIIPFSKYKKPLKKTPKVVKTLKLHDGQSEVFYNEHRFKVVVAGRRWGKSQLSKTTIIKKAMEQRKRLIWYVAPTYRMARSIMWPELLEAIPRKLIARINDTRLSITLINGSVIELKGADKPDTLRGIALHYLVMDEVQDIKAETWNKVLRPTLTSTRGEALFIGTPKAYNWLYDLYMKGQRGKVYKSPKGVTVKNNWKSWQFPTITSPFIPKSEIEDARADMDEKSFKQEFEASFETMSGRVYHCFDRKIHVGNYPFNPRLPIWIGQDFNNDPMSSVIMQPQPNGEIWVVDECILLSSNTQETADELSRRYFRYFRRITVYPDPAGQNRSHTRGESDLDILRDAGFNKIKYKRKHPKVADRVNAVNRMFKSADGGIRMRVDKKCKETITALEQTIYKPGSREVDKSAGVEHAADALGYCIDIEFPSKNIKILGVSI